MKAQDCKRSLKLESIVANGMSGQRQLFSCLQQNRQPQPATGQEGYSCDADSSMNRLQLYSGESGH